MRVVYTPGSPFGRGVNAKEARNRCSASRPAPPARHDSDIPFPPAYLWPHRVASAWPMTPDPVSPPDRGLSRGLAAPGRASHWASLTQRRSWTRAKCAKMAHLFLFGVPAWVARAGPPAHAFSNFSRHPKPVFGKYQVGPAVWTRSGRMCGSRKPLMARPVGNSNRATAYEHEPGHSETADHRRFTHRRPEPPASGFCRLASILA